MLELYRTNDCRQCDEVEQRLRELVVAHRVKLVAPGVKLSGAPPPVLREGQRLVSGQQELTAYLDALAADLWRERSISGDACYLDPDDPTRCL